MTPTELILMHLAIRPMGFNELMRATALNRSTLRRQVELLAGEGRVHLKDHKGHHRLWHFGADPLYKCREERGYSIQREQIAPGHVVVRFGDRWRAGHGQRPPATPGRSNALGNIYA